MKIGSISYNLNSLLLTFYYHYISMVMLAANEKLITPILLVEQ